MGMDSLILTALVGGLCSNPSPSEYLQEYSNQRACNLGIEATARQSGVYTRLRQWENKQKNRLERKAKSYIKDENGKVVATLLVTTSIAMGNRAMFKLGKGFFDGNYHLEASNREIELGVGWDF